MFSQLTRSCRQWLMSFQKSCFSFFTSTYIILVILQCLYYVIFNDYYFYISNSYDQFDKIVWILSLLYCIVLTTLSYTDSKLFPPSKDKKRVKSKTDSSHAVLLACLIANLGASALVSKDFRERGWVRAAHSSLDLLLRKVKNSNCYRSRKLGRFRSRTISSLCYRNTSIL